LKISDDQLARWKTAASLLLAAQTHKQLAQAFAGQSSSAKAAARALELNEEQAAHNDPYGQLRMGERYLTGDGVPKNPALAKAYLKQAADQGSPTAAEELKKLTDNISGNSG
jgi:TPR repeat protein